MRPWISASIIAAIVFLSAGCASTPRLKDLVGDQMSRDFGCPSDDVEVVEVGEERFGASGCGQSLAYMVYCEGNSASSCVVIREHQPGAPMLPDQDDRRGRSRGGRRAAR